MVADGSSLLQPGFPIKSGPSSIPWGTTGARTDDHVLTLVVEPAPQEVTTNSNSAAVGVSRVEQPTHAVAVGGLAPTTADGVSSIGTSDAPSGPVLNVNINVSVLNRGSVTDTILLSLFDDTANRTIAQLALTTDPGDDLLLDLPWDTRSASAGGHSLTTTATLSGEAATSANHEEYCRTDTGYPGRAQLKGGGQDLPPRLRSHRYPGRGHTGPEAV